jgi:hypothetical protein
MNARQVLDVLQSAGLGVTLTPQQGLMVRPASALTPDLRELIRQSKEILIGCLVPLKNPASEVPDPTNSSLDWKELSTAYYLHHFRCATCISAGRGYGLRCGAGAAMWRQYSHAD